MGFAVFLPFFLGLPCEGHWYFEDGVTCSFFLSFYIYIIQSTIINRIHHQRTLIIFCNVVLVSYSSELLSVYILVYRNQHHIILAIVWQL